MDKVKLPHDVAKDIEQLRDMDFVVDNRSIITAFCTNDYDGYPALVRYAGTNFDDLLKALVNGYEVDETPEDKVKSHWINLASELENCHPDNKNRFYIDGQLRGLRKTLDLLNIKIEGIN